jgi:hypothetical protein
MWTGLHLFEQLDPVFGLGAILAVILTGRPPFEGASPETVRVRAAQGDVADCLARLGGCGAEPGLVDLCRRCLSPRQDDRPADAGEVAKAVAGLRAAADERARRAELERVRAETDARAQRQRRRAEFAAAAGLLGTLVLLQMVGFKDEHAVLVIVAAGLLVLGLLVVLGIGGLVLHGQAAARRGLDRARRDAALRAKALAWLRDDLAARRKQAASLDAAERKQAADKLSWWQNDPELEALRPGPARAELPSAERDEWDRLWADVKAALAEAQKPPRDGKPATQPAGAGKK